MGTNYWPPNIPRDVTLDAITQAFESVGFTVCNDPAHEDGYERVAVFAKTGNTYTHAARQLEDGRWTSKLGPLEDIEHDHLVGVEGDEYGEVVTLMKRVRASADEEE